MRSVGQLMDLTGRKALIAGGGGHIGAAAGEALVELGARVAILDQDRDAGERAVGRLQAIRGQSAVFTTCDLANEADTRQAVTEVIRSMDGIDIVVHCAAFVGTTDHPGWATSFDKQNVDAWDRAIRVGLTSAFVTVQQASDSLSRSGRGTVIFLNSIYGVVGPDMSLYEGTAMANPVGYGVTKGGLLQLSRYLATLLAPSVRVNCISPGGVWRGQPEIFRARYERRTPLRRMATEEDLKGAVAYLASDLSAYVTGHNLVVDGGWTAW